LTEGTAEGRSKKKTSVTTISQKIESDRVTVRGLGGRKGKKKTGTEKEAKRGKKVMTVV